MNFGTSELQYRERGLTIKEQMRAESNDHQDASNAVTVICVKEWLIFFFKGKAIKSIAPKRAETNSRKKNGGFFPTFMELTSPVVVVVAGEWETTL